MSNKQFFTSVFATSDSSQFENFPEMLPKYHYVSRLQGPKTSIEICKINQIVLFWIIRRQNNEAINQKSVFVTAGNCSQFVAFGGFVNRIIRLFFFG
jgi:hypothetical protein